jgi:dUTP pyrophosphatase
VSADKIFLNWGPVDRERYHREPSKAHMDDAGFDLYVSEDTWVPPGRFRDIPTNVRMILPRGHWGLLTGRSSTLRKRGLMVNPGVIDTGYRGELYAGVFNLTDQTVVIRRGDRIAQFILTTNPTERTQLMTAPDSLFDTLGHARGTAGFGSSGL